MHSMTDSEFIGGRCVLRDSYAHLVVLLCSSCGVRELLIYLLIAFEFVGDYRRVDI